MKSPSASRRKALPDNKSFSVERFLQLAGVARKLADFKKKETIFSQGDQGKTQFFYLQKGGVRLSVVNRARKRSRGRGLGPGDFFGEGCLAGQPWRLGTASAMSRLRDHRGKAP